MIDPILTIVDRLRCETHTIISTDDEHFLCHVGRLFVLYEPLSIKTKQKLFRISKLKIQIHRKLTQWTEHLYFYCLYWICLHIVHSFSSVPMQNIN